MEKPLSGKSIAILVANGFEEVQMTEPQRALIAAGAAVKIVSSEQALVNGWHGAAWGHYFPVDAALSSVLAADFDALIVPGGDRSIDKLSGQAHTKRFIKGFVDGGKPILLAGRAVSLLVAAERAAGRTVVAHESDREALVAAGATISEEAVNVDRALLTLAADVEGGVMRAAVLKLVSDHADSLEVAA